MVYSVFFRTKSPEVFVAVIEQLRLLQHVCFQILLLIHDSGAYTEEIVNHFERRVFFYKNLIRGVTILQVYFMLRKSKLNSIKPTLTDIRVHFPATVQVQSLHFIELWFEWRHLSLKPFMILQILRKFTHHLNSYFLSIFPSLIHLCFTLVYYCLFDVFLTF